MKWTGLYTTFVHIQAKLGNENLMRIQTHDSKFKPLRSEAENATSRSQRLPTILNFMNGWGRNIFVSFKPLRPEKLTPNSSVKGSHANRHPRAPALQLIWGTGMIASSSTFCPHPGRVIRDLFRQLHAVWHSTQALVYSYHPREAAAFSYLAIIFGRIASGVPWFLCSTVVLMQLTHQCWRWCRLW